MEEIRAQYHCDTIYRTPEEGSERDLHIYRKFGFVSTGEVDEGETIHVCKSK